MKLVTLRWGWIQNFGENPECRSCGYILMANEKVYHAEGHGYQGSYFCRNCIETKDIIVYPMRNIGRVRSPINYSLLQSRRLTN